MSSKTNLVKVLYTDVRIESQNLTLVDNLSLEIKSGELVYFYGPPHSGSQALIKSVYRDIKISKGEAQVLDINVKKGAYNELSQLRKQIGILLNENMLIDHLSVGDNIKLFSSLHSVQQSTQELHRELSYELKLNPDTYVQDLSETEKLKLRFAISLINNPQVYLIEHALDRFDLEFQTSIMSELITRARNSGLTVLISTENQSLINQFPGRVFQCINKEIKELT